MNSNLEKCINDNVGLIWKIAKYFYNVDKCDLYQAGILGIIKAYSNYQDNSNAKFSSYAYNYIYGEMYQLACNKEMKYGKDLINLVKKIEKAKSILTQKIMKEPSIEELATFLEIPEEKIKLAILSANNIVSIDDTKDDARPLSETIAVKNEVSNDDLILLKDSINNLNMIERDIIISRYYEDLTQMETAKKLGITQVKVSRYETRSLKKMHDYMYM